MRIKTVSEITGLTSRAIRVYIDEKLISPHFTENYLGRRSFDFSEKDIHALQEIATLRKYGFSIDEIRKIIVDAANSIEVIESVKKRTQKQIEEYRTCLSALSRVEDNKAYSVSELAEILSQTETELTIPAEVPRGNILRIIKGIIIFIAVWLPVFFVLSGLLMEMNSYSFPKINGNAVLLTVLCVVPSVLVIAMPKIKLDYKGILIILCVISIPFSFIMPHTIVTCSETTDFRNYRDFDPACLANRSPIFGELFPAWPHYFDVKNEDGNFETVYLDAKYYYRYYRFMDYTYDIYAEWPLDEEDFGEEVNRARGVFEKYAENKTSNNHFVEMKKGDYSCLILYYGTEPFERVTNSYTYLIFAYNEKTNTVRYICCDSLENGADQPYYLQLEW